MNWTTSLDRGKSLRRRIRSLLVLAVALACPAVTAQAEDVAVQPKAPNARTVARRALRELSVGEAFAVGPLQVVLLEVPSGFPQSTLRPALRVKDLSFREPTVLEDAEREDVVALHPSEHPVFLPGGSVLLGGRVDRISRQDVILSGKAGATLLEALPVSLGKVRQADLPLRLVPAWAGDQVRRYAAFGGNAVGIAAYLERFGGLTPKKADDLSLLDIRRGEKAQALLKGVDTQVRALREAMTPHTVGYVAWHEGQLQSAEVFGSSELLRVHVTAAVQATVTKAALVVRYASVLGLGPEPTRGLLPHAWSLTYTRGLLSRIRISAKTEDLPRPAGTLGRPLRIALTGLTGRALVHEHDLVHVSFFGDDAREAQLFVPVAAPKPGSTPGGTSGTGTANGTTDAGQAELDRRAERGTLTEAEKRRRERLRGGGGATPPNRTPTPPRVPTPPRTPVPPRNPAPPGGGGAGGGGTPAPPGIGR